MDFPITNATSIKADIAKGQTSITFKMAINEENMKTADQLAQYVDNDHGKLELRITPKQPQLFEVSH